MIHRVRPVALFTLVVLCVGGGVAIARGDSGARAPEGSLGYWVERARRAESKVEALELELSRLRSQLGREAGGMGRRMDDAAQPAQRTPAGGSRGAAVKKAATCDPPFVISDGIKVYRDCVPQAGTTDGCMPPYRFDAAGVKHFLPECVD